jgi:uncharacterized membrane protein YkoI
MPISRHLSTLVLFGLVALTAAPALAADPQPARACLTKVEQAAAVAANKAIPLAQALKTLRERGHRAELVRARLCRHGETTLVYELTLLPRNGKVASMTVDAANGELINSR